MRGIFIFVSAFLYLGCAHNSSIAKDRTPTSDSDLVSAQGHDAQETSQLETITAENACDPRASKAPLEIKISRKDNQLALYRDGKLVVGYPILALSSGVPEVEALSPSELKLTQMLTLSNSEKRNFPAKFNNVFLFTPEKFFIASSNVKTMTSWSKEKKEAYKRQERGLITVDPEKMKLVFACAQKFKTKDVKISVQ